MLVSALSASGQELLRFALTYLLHSTLALGGTWLLVRWRGLPPAWEETLWKAALFGSVVTAGLQVWVGAGSLAREVRLEADWRPHGERAGAVTRTPPPRPEPPVPSRPSGAAVDVSGTDAGPANPGSRSSRADPSGGEGAPDTGGTGGSIPWTAASFLVWVLVAAGLLARTALRHRRFYSALQDRRPLHAPRLRRFLDELADRRETVRPLRLTVSDAVPAPAVLGRREICVPGRFLTGLGPRSQRSALAHELAHVARRDGPWNLAASLLAAVLFFQPLNWVAVRRLRAAAEYLADDWAVRRGCQGLHLARCLSEVAAWHVPPEARPVAATAAIVERDSALIARTRRLLEGDAAAPAPSAAARLAGTGSVVLALLIAGPRVAVTPAPPSTDPARAAVGRRRLIGAATGRREAQRHDEPGHREPDRADDGSSGSEEAGGPGPDPGTESQPAESPTAAGPRDRDRGRSLERAFVESTDRGPIRRAARELARHRPGRAVRVFLEVITHRPGGVARAAAIRHLRELPDSLALPALEDLAGTHPDPAVREEASEWAAAKRARGS